MCSDFTITLQFPFPLEHLKASEGKSLDVFMTSGFQCCAEEVQSNEGGSESH